MNAEVDGLILRLRREASAGSLGPLSPASRHIVGMVVCHLLRVANLAGKLSDFPCGLIASALPLECRLRTACPSELVQALTVAIAGDLEGLQAQLSTLPLPDPLT